MSTRENGAQARGSSTSAQLAAQFAADAAVLPVDDTPTVTQDRLQDNTSQTVSNNGEDAGSELPPNVRTTSTDVISSDIFEDNILTKFDNPTYNFRLFMTTENVKHETLPFSDSVIIAETGSTGFNITDVQMDTIISPSQATQNTFSTTVVIRIIEPFGTSLLDFIRRSAAALGVKAHQNSPMWLDLRFKGYTEGLDESSQGGEFASLSDQTRTWKLRVIKVDIEMNKGGTEYTMELVSQDEHSLEDSARRLQEKIKISASTVGEFINKFEEILNKYEDYSIESFIDKNRNKDQIESIRQYAFALPGDPILVPDSSPKQENERKVIRRESITNVSKPMRDWAIRGYSKDKSVKSETFKKLEDAGGAAEKEPKEKWQILFEKATPIETIIQEVIASTEEGQSLLLFGEPGKKISQNPESRNPLLPSVAFVVDPTVEFLSYNGLAKAYNIRINYNIRTYKSYIPVVTRQHIVAAQSVKASKDRIKAMLEVSRVKKLYNYMFTGENTEILDYKVELNSTWFISLPLFRGQARATAAISGRDIIDGESQQINQNKSPRSDGESIIALTEEIQQTRDDIDDADTPEEIAEAQAALARALGNQAVLAARVREQIQQPLGTNQNITNTSTFGLAERRIRLANDAVSPGTVTRNNRTTPATNLNNSGSIFFAEDFNEVGNDDTQNRQIDENSQIMNVGAQISPSTANAQNGVEGVRSLDRSFFATAINQIYGFKGQLIELDMEIRGDPYWLGEPNTFKRLTNTAGFPDHTSTDSLIILTFKFPVALDDGGNETRDQSYTGTGLYTLKRQENGFNGVYRIFKVANSFSNGRFTQRLTGAIDPLTKEQDLISELEKNGN